MSCECDQKRQWGCDGCHDVTFSLQCSPRVASGAGDSAGGRRHKLVSGETNLVLGRKVSVCSTTIPCHNSSYKPCRLQTYVVTAPLSVYLPVTWYCGGLSFSACWETAEYCLSVWGPGARLLELISSPSHRQRCFRGGAFWQNYSENDILILDKW